MVTPAIVNAMIFNLWRKNNKIDQNQRKLKTADKKQKKHKECIFCADIRLPPEKT